MTDYAEERASELEVLESIFPDELEVLSEDKISIRVEPENQSETNPYILNLVVTYTPTYPDELPEMELEVVEGELSSSEETFLLDGLKTSGEESLGMAMVYTLSTQLRELISEMFVQRKERIAAEDEERYRAEEAAIAKKREGTKVTKESFASWSVKFEKEMQEVRKKEEQERLKGLPGKEREEAKRFLAKLTGRQLFESDSTLVGSDAVFGDEGDVAVDFSQYERRNDDDEDEDEDEADGVGERLRLADLSDDEQ
ncbi:Gir2p [Sporobolomyces salmoneus]|uniref:Gir2p n=1 Tax=Sporobolomyces salmoneus TaxID=183962 RepID=UPI003170BC18